MSKNILVQGGNVTGLSNRAKELYGNKNLKDLPLEDVIKLTETIKNCKTPEDLSLVLSSMSESNINFVGTRGYIYMSYCMLQEFNVDSVNIKAYDPEIYTRSCGLRQKVHELLIGEKTVLIKQGGL